MSKNIFGIDPQKRTTIAGSKRNSGFQAEGVDYDELNQLLFELRADHIIGDATQLSNNDCTCVFQSSDQTFRDSQGALVTFANGEKIIWAGLDTITASIDISTIDDLTHETLTGVTIALGSYDLDLGENQRGELDISGTGTLTVLSSDGLRVKTGGNLIIDNQDGDIIIDNNINRPEVDFKSKDLILNVQTVSQVKAWFTSQSLLDSNYVPKFLYNKEITWNMPGDLESGQSEEASRDYGCWVDSDENVKFVVDVLGQTDGTTAGFLDDSTNTFATRLIKVGDIVYNLTDKTETTVKTAATVNGNPLEVVDDIFVSGDDYKIEKRSPEGLGANRERLGTVENDSGSAFNDSWYTQIQEEKTYSESDGDFTVTGGTWTTNDAEATIRQVNDWTGRGEWEVELNHDGDLSVASASTTLATTGIIFKTGKTQGFSQVPNTPGGAAVQGTAETSGGNNSVLMLDSSAGATKKGFKGKARLDKKPTFHL